MSQSLNVNKNIAPITTALNNVNDNKRT